MIRTISAICTLVTLNTVAFVTPGWAQVVSPDGTLNTTVTRSGNNFTIINGTAVGANLFHSFQNFSIPTGGSATFNLLNTPDISTIFSRVTGGNSSNIDGLVRTLNNRNPVNLFLMNPNGIIFGPNARLNISGSFVGTTASQVRFQDGIDFNISNPAPLLTIALPIGLQFGSVNAGIQVNGTGHRFTSASVFAPTSPPNASPLGLMVNPGKTIALLGNGIDLNGGLLSAFGGRIALESVQPSTSVSLTTDALGFQVDTLTGGSGDIRLDQKAAIDVSGILGASAGQVQLQGRNLSVLGGSAILSQNTGGLAANTVSLKASERLLVSGIASDRNFVSQIQSETIGLGTGANLEIQAKQLDLLAGGLIRSATFSPKASGGQTSIIVQNSLKISDFAPLYPVNRSGVLSVTLGNAQAGNVYVAVPWLELTKAGNLSAVTIGRGNGGNIKVDSKDIIVTDTDPITAVNTVLTTSTVRSGLGGELVINTERLSVLKGAAVGASTLGAGNAGKVTINASDFVTVKDIVPLANGGAQGSNINSSGTLVDPVTAALLGASSSPTGNANSVTINTRQLNVSQAFIRVRNGGSGDGGTLTVNADRVILENKGFLATTTVSGNGGNIVVNARDFLLLRNGASINTTAGGAGNGGDIGINAGSIVAIASENSDIIANATKGRGGNIQIMTQAVFGLKYRSVLTPKSDITASSEFGINGTVQVNSLSVNPSVGLIALPSDVTDPSQRISAGCAAMNGSSFVQTGRGGIPKSPAQRNAVIRLWNDLQDHVSSKQAEKLRDLGVVSLSERSPLLEATALTHNSQSGELELVAGQVARSSDAATCAVQ